MQHNQPYNKHCDQHNYARPCHKTNNPLLAFIIMSIAFCIFSLFSSAIYAGVTLKSVIPQSINPIPNSTYRALIIGNDEYRDPQKKWPSLKTAISDAKAIKQVLTTNYGFNDVTYLTNATRRDILHALSDLSKRVMPTDSVLVYYAGHGYLDPNTKKGYWVPVNAEGDDTTTYLRNSTIRDELSIISSRAKHTLLISDSCFSGSLLRSTSRGYKPQSNTKKYYKKVADKKSIQIIAAGGVEYVDDNYNNSGHSPFTYFLLSELKSNDSDLITASEVSNKVEKAVANNVDQVPESGVLQGAGDEMGEFIFIKLKIDVEVKGLPKDKVIIEVVPTLKPSTPSKKPAADKVQKHTTAPVIKQEKAVETDNSSTIIHFPSL